MAKSENLLRRSREIYSERKCLYGYLAPDSIKSEGVNKNLVIEKSRKKRMMKAVSHF